MSYQEFIIKCLRKSSEIASSYFGKVQGVVKPEDQNQVVTGADIAVGKFIIEEVKKEFPTYNIIDEEVGAMDNHSEFTWVIDPIDGTSNFANNIPLYGVMIGLLEGNEPIAGGVSLPFFNEIYYAEKNQGAFCNGKKIRVTREENIESVLIAFGIDGDKKNPEVAVEYSKVIAGVVNQVRNIRSSHSVYDLMLVAKGNYGGIFDFNSYKIWDHVAPQVIIKEAGGIYTNIESKELDYSDPLTKLSTYYSLCAASPVLHKKLQTIIHEHT